MENKVGIVVLTYNSANVVIECLKGLAIAKNEVNYELYMLDNASILEEYNQIRQSFDDIQKSHSCKLNWTYERLDYNSGYPAGNNIGIKRFLNDQSITHICLLNSDVIVTDGWLDKLLALKKDAVGPVTNRCGNEQTLSIPFNVDVNNVDFKQINDFAAARSRLFPTAIFGTNFLGFFCFLGSRELFERVGLLDEGFGRGAYEDDDFCFRMKQFGYDLEIHRGVFVYHFGSASFSNVPVKAFVEHLKKNRKMFEDKYQIKWQNRDILPYIGFGEDMNYLLETNTDHSEVKKIFGAYYEDIKLLLDSMFTDKRILQESTGNCNDNSIIKRICKLFEVRNV